MTTTTELSLSRLQIERLPNFRRKTRAGEYSATCPVCGGVDRFLFWEGEGNYFCRRCEIKGFISDSVGGLLFSQEQYEAWKRAERERKAKERQQQLAIIQRLTQASRSDLYHQAMTNRSYWHDQGLND